MEEVQVQADELTDAEVDAMARATHERWLARSAHRAASNRADGAAPSTAQGAPPTTRGPGPAWEDLDAAGQEASRDSVRFAPVILAALGFGLERGDAGEPPALSAEEVEVGARLEHLRWSRFTVRSGRTDHPDLVPWSQLDEPTRELDRARVRESAELLASVGWSVHRVP